MASGREDGKTVRPGLPERVGYIFEALEPRLLLSADPIGLSVSGGLALDLLEHQPPAELEALPTPDALLAGLSDRPQAANAVGPDAPARSPLAVDLAALAGLSSSRAYSQAEASQRGAETSREVLFVDPQASDYQQLLDGLSAGGRELQVFVLDADRDGIAQIGEVLAGHEGIDAVHIVSHGSQGGIQLGSTWLTGQSLSDHAREIEAWRAALAENADLLIYGCNLAAGEAGQALVESLGELTGADVAASEDPTGHASLGGDWELEYALGSIESTVAFDIQAQQAWLNVLGDNDPLWLTTAQDVPSSNGVPGMDGVGWQQGDALAMSGPPTFGPGTTSGAFSMAFDMEDFSPGANIDALHYVTSAITVGNTVTLDLQPGDLLLSTDGNQTLVSNGTSPLPDLDVKKEDVFVFRPDAPGDYSQGNFFMLLQDLVAQDITAITLVEKNTAVGDVVLQKGDFLFSDANGSQDQDIWLFETDNVEDADPGTTTTSGNALRLLAGTDPLVGVQQKVIGLELVESATTLGGVNLAAGTLLAKVDVADTVGSNGLSVTEHNIFAFSVARATSGPTSTGEATASLFFDNSLVGLDASEEMIDGFTLTVDNAVNQPPVLTATGPFSVNENSPPGTVVGTVTASDPDIPGVGSTLIISEVMFDPAGGEPDWEWVELYNPTSAAIDLTGYVFDDTNTLAHTAANIAAGSVAPGTTAVLFNADALSSADFEAAWGSDINLIPVTDWGNLQLNNDGDKLSLWASFADYVGDHQTHANAQLTFGYEDLAPWPAPDGAGSIFLTDLTADPGDGSNWALSTIGAATPLGGTTYQSTAAAGNTGADVASPGDGPASPLTYAITGNVNADGDGNPAFSIDPATGIITVNDPGDLDYEFTASLTITVQADDGEDQASALVTIDLNNVNEAPSINSAAGYGVSEDDGPSGIGGVSVADPDAGAGELAFTLSVANGTLDLGSTTGLTLTAGAYGTATLTVTGTVANLNAALGTLSYQPAPDFYGADTLSLGVDDQGNTGSGSPLTDSRNLTISVAGINDDPSNAGGVPAGFEVVQDAATPIDLSPIDLADVDAGSGTLTLILSTGGGGTLTASGGAGLTIGGSGSDYVTVDGTLADLNAFLDDPSSVRYLNDAGTTADTVAVAIDDNGNTGSGGGTPVNLGSVAVGVTAGIGNSVPPGQTTGEDSVVVFSTVGGNAITVGDGTASDATLRVSLTVTNGMLLLPTVAGLTFESGANGSPAMTFSGSESAINAALDGLTYTPSADYSGPANLQITTDLSDGLEGHYSFDNPADPGNDDSPSGGSDAVIVGATPTVDPIRGDVLSFDGNDYARVSGQFGKPSDVTLAAWVKMDAGFSDGEAVSLGNNVAIQIDDTGTGVGVTGFFDSGATWLHTDSGTYIAGTGWHHVAFSFDDANNQQTLYLDGVVVATTNFLSSISYALGNDTYLGRNAQISSQYLNGSLDDVRIYGRVLSAAEVSALFAGQASATDSIAITVNPVADTPTATVSPATGNEDSPIALSVATGLTDTDGSETLQTVVSAIPLGATLSDGTNSFTATAGNTSVDVSTWTLASLSITPPLDDDSNFTLTVTATATDGTDSAINSTNLDVTVNALADVPTVNVSPAAGNEDSPIALAVASATTDGDGSETVQTVISAIPVGATLGDGTNSFTATAGNTSVDVTTWTLASLAITPPLDDDSDFTLTVTAIATDGADTASNSANLTVTVNPVNDPPTGISLSSSTEDEHTDTTGGHTVATLTATDADASDSFSYAIVGGADAGVFAIGGVGGDELILDDGVLDYEAQPSYQVVVRVTDSGGLTHDETFTITINDLNDAPVITSGNTVSIAENATAVMTVTATDQDVPANTLTYGIAGGSDQALFSIDPVSGALTFNTAPDFESPADAGGDNVYEVQVQVGDGNGGTDTRTVNVTVTNVNENPVASDDSYTVAEDGTLDSNATWFDGAWSSRRRLSFDNAAQTEDLTDFPVLIALDASRIDYSQTQDNGQDLRFVDGDGTVLAHDIEVWDESGTSYVWVKVPRVDGGSDTDFIWMYYGNPTAPDGQNAAAVWTNDFQAVYHLDEDPGAGGTVVDSSGAFDATNAGSTDAAGYIAGAQAFNGTDQYVDLGADRPFLNNVGGATISGWVNADDTGSGTLLGVSVGGAPTADSRATLDFGGGTVKVIGRSTDVEAGLTVVTAPGVITTGTWHHVAGVVDYAGDTLTIYIDGVQAASASSVGFSAGLTPGTNSARATLGSNEDGSGFLDGIIDEARISDVARSADWIAAQYASMSGAFVTYGNEQGAAGVLGNDVDADGDPLTAVLVTGPANAAAFSLNADGSFTYTPTPDFCGVDSFTYVANDGTWDSNVATVSITVTPVNDPPTATGIGNVVVDEDAPDTVIDLFGAFADIESPDAALSYTVTANSNPGLFTATTIDGAAGTLTLGYVPGENGTANITVRATDPGGQFVETSFTVTVNPVNDAPVLSTPATVYVVENTTAVTTVSATDEDLPPDTLSFSLAGGTDQGFFSIDPVGGVLSFNVPPDFDLPADANGDNVYQVAVQVDDGNGGSDTRLIDVAVTPATSIGQASTGPAVDGAVDAIWSRVFAHDIDTSVWGSSPAPADLSGSWRSLWDANNLYLLVEVTDDALVNDSGPLAPWFDDTVEVFIDADYSRGAGYDGVNDFQYTFTYNDPTVRVGVNSVPDTTGVSFSLVTTANGYRLETAIPWSTLGVAPGAGNLIGLEVHVDDDDDGGGGDGKLVWAAPADVSSQVPASFGTATLGGMVNSAPVITSPPTASAPEGTAGPVLTVTATDADGDTPAFSIVGGADAGRFSIDATTGELRFTAPPDFEAPVDADTDNVYEVQVQAADGFGGAEVQAVSVTITNLNESPITNDDPGGYSTGLLGLGPLSYWRLGDAASGTAADSAGSGVNGSYTGVAGTQGAIQGDTDGAAQFNGAGVVGIPHDPAFALSQGTVQLWFKTGDVTQRGALLSKDSTDFDAGGHLSLWLDNGRIEARLQSASTDHFLYSASGSVTADTWHHLAFTFGAPDGMKLYLDGQLVDAGAYGGGIAANGEPIALGASTDGSGDGTLFPLRDYFVGAIDEVAVFGAALSAQEVQTLHLAATAGQDYTVQEDGVLSVGIASGLLANDFDPDGDALTVTAAAGTPFSGATTLTLPSGALLTIADDGTLAYDTNGVFDSLAAGDTTTESFSYTVDDGNGGTDTATATVTIVGANDTPSTPALSAASVDEHTDTTGGYSLGQITATDPDAGDALTYAIAGGPDATKFTLGGPGGDELLLADGVLDYEGHGAYQVIVRVTDAGGLSRDGTFTIAVTDLNDGPVAINLSNASLAENTDTSGGYGVGTLSALDPDAGDTVTYTIVGGADAARFSIGGANALILSDGILDYETQASYQVIVRATDAGGLSHDQSLTITVTDQDESEPPDPPVDPGLTDDTPPDLAPPDVPGGTPPDPPPDPDEPPETSGSGSGSGETDPGGGSGTGPGAADPSEGEPESPTLAPSEEAVEAVILGGDGRPAASAAWGATLASLIKAASISLPGFETVAPAALELAGLGETTLSLDDLQGLMDTGGFRNGLDSLREEIAHDLRFDKTVVGSTIVASTGLSVGYVLWLVRGGVLLSSVLSSMPAWRLIDPLPVLAYTRERSEEEEGEDESLESLVKERAESAETVQEDGRAEHAPAADRPAT